MQNNMQLLKSICRIVHCLYSAYSAYTCTPHFADGIAAEETVTVAGTVTQPSGRPPGQAPQARAGLQSRSESSFRVKFKFRRPPRAHNKTFKLQFEHLDSCH